MIQTKNKYCKETFIRLNYWYDRIHGLVYSFNGQSQRMFQSVGFEKTAEEWYESKL